MAGYTSRNFLSLTIPSVLGLSIIWFLKKRSDSKHLSEAIEFQDKSDCTDQYSTLYPMKLKNTETNSVEEVPCADMQLKETESTAENQQQTSNGVVQQNPKVKGKSEDMTRLCGSGNSCSVDAPLTNGCTKDKVTIKNGDSNFEITNGINGISLQKDPFTNGTSKTGEMEKIANGSTSKSNCVLRHVDDSCKSETQTSVVAIKEDTITLNTEVEINKPCPEDIELADAKEQHQTDVCMQSSIVCNGSSSKDTKSNPLSTDATLTAEKLLTPFNDHMDAVSNGFSSISIDTTLTDTEKELIKNNSECKVININEQLLTQSVCEVTHSDKSSQKICKLEEPSTSHCSIVDVEESSASPVTCILTDNENPIVPCNDSTAAEQLLPPDDYVVADSTELLTLPLDDTEVAIQGEMLESPGATYCDSLGSNDSGRGASEIQFTLSEDQVVYMVYEFEILPENCGRLIGKLGRHVKYINKQTNANIVIKKHPCCTDKKLCAITGTETEINAALKLIRKRFPIEHYPSVTLAQINSIPISTLLCPETLKLSLPEGGVFEALLCSTVNAGHFFLQQPTHPTFYQLPPLTNAMNALYGQTETPILDDPTKGNICAAEIGGGWYRAEIDEVYEESDNCRLKFLDYGGYADVPKSSIRKIKCDFMLIPFQATECYLAGVMPLDNNGWSTEATSLFEQEAQGQLIQGCIVAYAENRVPYVNLYKITGVESVFINQKLINDGLARGITLPAIE